MTRQALGLASLVGGTATASALLWLYPRGVVPVAAVPAAVAGIYIASGWLE